MLQTLTWPLASALHRSEEISVQVLSPSRFLSHRVLAATTFGLHRLIDEPHIQLEASLVDHNARPVKVSLCLHHALLQ